MTPLSGDLTIAGIMTAQQLDAWRKHMGISVAKAAEMLGISRQSFYQYARGLQQVPRAIELACAALTLGVRSYPPAPSSPEPSASASFVLAAPFSGPPGSPSMYD